MASEIQLPSNKLQRSPSTSDSLEKIVVCLGRSCRKYQAREVFDNFKQNLPAEVELMSVPCLGQCGNGAMVVVDSDKTWYSQVHPDEVKAVIQQHVIGKSPVKAMLYPKFHK